MKMPAFVCATCSQDFTRRYSGNRHNLHIHSGKGLIIRFLDYIVGRVNGQYAAADPLLYRRNKGNKFRYSSSNVVNADHPPSSASCADSIMENESHEMSPNHKATNRIKDSSNDFSSLDYTINLARTALDVENLKSLQQLPERRFGEPCHSHYKALIGNFVYSEFIENRCIFGYVGYVCPICAYAAIIQAEFMSGTSEKRTWSADHNCKCNIQYSAEVEKSGSMDIQYTDANDNMPYLLDAITRVWLKNNINIFAIKLPSLYFMKQGLIEIRDITDLSRSICVPISKEMITTLTSDNREYWAARVIANENEPVSINKRETLDFFYKTQNSTFGVFNISSKDQNGGAGWNSEYFLLYVGNRAVGEVNVFLW